MHTNQSNLSNTHSNSTITNTGGQTTNANNLIYNLPEGLTTRSMCSLTADEENHRFLVGTCSLQKSNELHLLNFAEDTNRVDIL